MRNRKVGNYFKFRITRARHVSVGNSCIHVTTAGATKSSRASEHIDVVLFCKVHFL